MGNVVLPSGRCRRQTSHSSGVSVLVSNLLLHLRVRQRLQERRPVKRYSHKLQS